MKHTLALLILALTLISCISSDPKHYTVPAGYQTCNGPGQCPSGYYCGFVGVDTYAVCKHR